MFNTVIAKPAEVAEVLYHKPFAEHRAEADEDDGNLFDRI
jgi:hypothetical protein